MTDHILHWGVLGMKWGHRKSTQWQNKVSSRKAYYDAYNKAADRMNSVHIPAINNHPKYKGKNFNLDENKALFEEYKKEFTDRLYSDINRNLKETFGNDPLGQVEARYGETPEGELTFDFVQIQHSDYSVALITKRDSLGHIISVEPYEGEIKHWGILGMKWGRRKAQDDRPIDPSADHIRSRSIASKKVEEMSNEEIKVLANRLQLEKQLRDATAAPQSPAKKFVNDWLASAAKEKVKDLVSKGIDAGLTLAGTEASKRLLVAKKALEIAMENAKARQAASTNVGG